MMSSPDNPAARLVSHLRRIGFTVEEGSRPGEYVVTARDSEEMPLRPRLSLPADLLAEYLNKIDTTPGAAPPGLSAESLAEVHLEEELSTSGWDGKNYCTAVGVRRRRDGHVEWFSDRRPTPDPPQYGAPPEDLEWRADPPR